MFVQNCKSLMEVRKPIVRHETNDISKSLRSVYGLLTALMFAMILTPNMTAVSMAQQKTAEKSEQEKGEPSDSGEKISDTNQDQTESSNAKGEHDHGPGHDHDHGPGHDHDGPKMTPFGEIAEETVERDEEFEKRLAEWKKLTIELFRVRRQFDLASIAEARELRKQWHDLVARGEAIIEDLYTYGIEVYKRREKADTRIGFFLRQRAAIDVENRRYPRANMVFKMLSDSGLSFDKASTLFAGVAAYSANDFDRAQKLLDKAMQEGTIEEKTPGEAILSILPAVSEAWRQELEWRKLEKRKDDLPQALIVTTAGDITVELFENDAPNTVANFINLAENSFYDDNFVTARSDYFVETGSPSPDGKTGAAHTIEPEATPELHRAIFRGSLLMARDVDTGMSDSRFAICLYPAPPGSYGQLTCFGRVLSGMEVVDKLMPPAAAGGVEQADRIVRIEILRKRDHEYKVKKIGD